MITGRAARIAAAGGLVTSALAGSVAGEQPDPASASLNTFFWSAAGNTAITAGMQSNVVGLLQAVGRYMGQALCAVSQPFYIDGIYGSLTQYQAGLMLHDLPLSPQPIGSGNSIGATQWNAIEFAQFTTSPNGTPYYRLDHQAGINYGDAGFYSFYDGVNSNPLYFQGGSGLWKFPSDGASSSTWYNATTSRTMSSYQVC